MLTLGWRRDARNDATGRVSMSKGLFGADRRESKRAGEMPREEALNGGCWDDWEGCDSGVMSREGWRESLAQS